jgi:hypothetical protein
LLRLRVRVPRAVFVFLRALPVRLAAFVF